MTKWVSAVPVPRLDRAHARLPYGIGLLSSVGLALVLGVALWLRWRYLTKVGVHVDEFSTLWAARRVLETGIPLMPSGVLYPRGLFSTYVIAAVGALSQLNFTTGRLPSLVFGLLALLLINRVGKQIANWRVGLLATLGLALLPAAIESSGRARFYAPLLFWSLLATWSFLLILRPTSPAGRNQSPAWGLHLTFSLTFILAILSQEAVVLLYPPLLLAALLWRGWRYFVTPAALVAHVLIVAALASRLLLDLVGQAGQLAIIQETTPYLQLAIPEPATWRPLIEELFAVSRLPWTVGAVLMLAITLLVLYRARGQVTLLSWSQQSALYFALLFGFVLVMILTVVGDEWRHPRYALFIEPYLLLLGAAGIVVLLDRLRLPSAVGGVALILVAGLLFWLAWPEAERETRRELPGYAEAFAFVAAHQRPGDVVISPQAAGCALVLGQVCDYYAVGNGYEPFVVQRNQQWIDRWTGAPLLSSEQQLRHLLQTAGRVWFVTDGDRLIHRYAADFLLTTIEQFTVAFESNGVRALLAEGWHTPPVYAAQKRFAPPLNVGGLELATLDRAAPGPDGIVDLRLGWQKVDDFEKVRVNTSLQWVTASGERVAQDDGPLANNMVFPSEVGDDLVPDHKRLRLPDLPSGWHRLEVVAYDGISTQPFAPPVPIEWIYLGAPPPPPEVASSSRWQAGLRLLGYDRLPDHLPTGGALQVRLVWSAEEPIPLNASIFVHLADEQGTIVSQSDHQPLNGFLPTANWPANEPIEDSHSLPLPEGLAPGQYQLTIGWYQPEQNQRLPLLDGADQLQLMSWQVAGVSN